MRYSALLILLLFCGHIQGQWVSKPTPQQLSSKIATAIGDLDGDLLNDILTVTEAGEIVLLRQLPDHTYDQQVVDRLSTSLIVFSIAVADFNNDGNNDFVIAGETFIPRLYTQTADASFTVEAIGFTTIFAQGANALDVDADGWVDLFVCNDVGESTLYRNVNGVLEEWNLIDMKTAMPSDNSGNYSAIWLDVNDDGAQDLYIAKCRAGVEDPTDPRRINTLYINDAGTYREAATEYGIAIGHQSWSVSAGDLDNDGDEDLFLTNHYASDQILVNQGNQFEVIDLDFLPEHFAFQGVIADVNLDGRLDIVVSGAGLDFILFNKGNLEFDVDTDILQEYQGGLSITCGDIDNDGDIDLYKPQGDFGSDVVLVNPIAKTNNWVKLTLSTSAASVLQSKIFTYVNGRTTVHVPRAGESYGVHLPTTISVGLGQAPALDSIVVQWHGGRPSTTLLNLTANQHYLLSPDGCVGLFIDNDQSDYRICEGDLVDLMGPDGYVDYNWSHGAVGQSQQLGVGTYQATLTDADGCTSITAPIRIEKDELTGDYLQLSASSICNGQPVIASVDVDRLVVWSDSISASTREIASAVQLQAYIYNNCGDTLTQDVNIQELQALPPEDETITISTATPINFSSADTFVVRSTDGHIVFRGNDFTSSPVSSDTSFAVSTHVIDNPSTDFVGIANASTSFASDQFNSGIEFTVTEPIVLRSVDVFTDKPGIRRFAVEASDRLVWESNISIDSGYQVVPIDLFLEEGNYILKTVTAVNEASLGHPGPRFARSVDASFPYQSDGLTLSSTLNGVANYYYFYNWQYDRDLAICESDPATIAVRFSTSSDDQAKDNVVVYPNPASDYLTINADHQVNSVRVVDLYGQDYDLQINSNSIDVSGLPQGTYCLMLESFEKLTTHLFVKL